MVKSLRNFNPDRIAMLEANTWQAYYNHRFFKLFFLLFSLMREFFGFNFLLAVYAAYRAADATIDFRLHKGRENYDKILKKLTRFYKIFSYSSTEKFDYNKAAKLELDWWFVDRYPARYNISREKSIAIATAIVYGVDPSVLTKYAENRARAMVLQDEAEAKNRQADWVQVESMLRVAYQSLFEAIQ